MGVRIRTVLFVAGVLITAGAVLDFTGTAVLSNHSRTATGYLEPETVAHLNFGAQAAVTEVDVMPGDRVHAGEVLARQDVTALQAKLLADQATFAADTATVDEALSPPDRTALLAQLSAQVGQAQASLDGTRVKVAATASLDAASTLAAQSAVAAAQQTQAADQAQASALAPSCASATAPPPPPGQAPSTSPSMVSTCVQLAHQSAADAQAVVQAQGSASVAVATQQLDAATLGAAVQTAASEVAVAQANVAVQSSLPTAATVAADRANVAKDTAAVALDRQAIAAATIVAPMDGVVGAVGGAVGEIASQDGIRTFERTSTLPAETSSGIALFPQAPQQAAQPPATYGAAITLDSLQVQVVAQVAESQVRTLQLDRTVRVSLPALVGTKFYALVDRVEPQPVTENGSVYFLVDLKLFAGVPPLTSGTATDVSSTGLISSALSVLNLVGLTADVSL